MTKDTDEDGIPDDDDCTPTIADDHVVGPPGVVPPTFTGIRHDTLQEAVIAALDNQVISLLANTTENVVIGDSTGSGGKDLLIFGCGHRVTAASAGLPVIRVENSAGANDGDTGMGERDIEFVDVDVRNGSGGYLVETSRVAGAGTDTLLKGVRSESSSGIGIKVVGSGNEVRGSNGVKFHGSFGIQVIGDANLITENGIQDNAGIGLDVTGNNSLIKKNKAGEDGHGNGAGIRVAGDGNDLLENDVFANAGDGINVSGAGNLLQKNDVGDRDKGNAGDGIHVSGAGNTVDENNVFASGGDGIDVGGGTLASPNVVKNNDVGDRNKGNQGNGILVAGLGNPARQPGRDRRQYGQEQRARRHQGHRQRPSAQEQRERRQRRQRQRRLRVRPRRREHRRRRQRRQRRARPDHPGVHRYTVTRQEARSGVRGLEAPKGR